jgi:hypothetical protein
MGLGVGRILPGKASNIISLPLDKEEVGEENKKS